MHHSQVRMCPLEFVCQRDELFAGSDVERAAIEQGEHANSRGDLRQGRRRSVAPRRDRLEMSIECYVPARSP